MSRAVGGVFVIAMGAGALIWAAAVGRLQPEAVLPGVLLLVLIGAALAMVGTLGREETDLIFSCIIAIAAADSVIFLEQQSRSLGPITVPLVLVMLGACGVLTYIGLRRQRDRLDGVDRSC